MQLIVTITQEFIIDTNTDYYKQVLNSSITQDEVIDYITNQINTNQLYWNVLKRGKTEIKVD